MISLLTNDLDIKRIWSELKQDWIREDFLIFHTFIHLWNPTAIVGMKLLVSEMNVLLCPLHTLLS